MKSKMIKDNKTLLIVFTIVVISTSILILKSYMASRSPVSSLIEQCSKPVDQTVVEWKHEFGFPCKLSWRGICFWPLRRMHISYKVTLNGGSAVLNDQGMPIPIARGKVRNWSVYDAQSWNTMENNPRTKRRYPDYEKIASNEYVVLVETRYRLFNNVESTLRICAQ